MPRKIVVQGEKGSPWFHHSALYLTFSSNQGCVIRVTPMF
jgi:hypothetical protein